MGHHYLFMMAHHLMKWTHHTYHAPVSAYMKRVTVGLTALGYVLAFALFTLFRNEINPPD